MRIGIDIRPLTFGRRSGVEGYIINLLNSLFEIDQENEYQLFYNSFKGKVSKDLNVEGKNNVNLMQFKWPNKFLNFSLKFFKSPKIDQMLGGVDMLFEPNILFNAISPQCKSVVTFHDLSFEIHPRYYSFKRRLWHRMVNPKYLAKNADGIIAVSESTKKDLINIYGINPDKIKVIYSGLHRVINQDVAHAEEMKKKHQVPDKFLLYLGVIEPRKNIIGIISAFEKFKEATNNNYKLVLAGSEGWLSKKIIKKAKDSKYSQDIILYGYVTEEFKQYLMACAAIFLFPSFYEGFGFPPLEAMAASTPVLTSSVSSLPEVCGKAAVYADPYNVNEIKKAIITIIEDNHLRIELINQGKNQLEKYSWKRCAQDTKEFFEKFKE